MSEEMKLKTIKDGRGSLTVLERLPFQIKRVYYLHGIRKGETRGGHAHRTLKRVMVAANGCFKVSIRGKRWNDYTLKSPEVGLQIDPMEWVELKDFTDDAVCLVLASEEHDEADCIRDFQEYTRLRNK